MKTEAGPSPFSVLDFKILAAAESVLKTDQPETFDLKELARVCGIGHSLLKEQYPFPELLTLGLVMQAWWRWRGTTDLDLISDLSPGMILMLLGWTPDPELLKHFPGHPAVCRYHQLAPCLPLPPHCQDKGN